MPALWEQEKRSGTRQLIMTSRTLYSSRRYSEKAQSYRLYLEKLLEVSNWDGGVGQQGPRLPEEWRVRVNNRLMSRSSSEDGKEEENGVQYRNSPSFDFP